MESKTIDRGAVNPVEMRRYSQPSAATGAGYVTWRLLVVQFWAVQLPKRKTKRASSNV